MKVVLLSTYELGHQPFGLASPAAWLGEGQHIVEISAMAESAGEKRTRTFLLVAR